MIARGQNEAKLTAWLISPNRDLAQQFLATLPQTGAFQILADLKNYPPQQTLEIRARQLKPRVVLLDLASDLAAARRHRIFVRAVRSGHAARSRDAAAAPVRERSSGGAGGRPCDRICQLQ